MSGTPSGGAKARDTNKRKYGQDFYVRIGTKGGKNGHTGGFYDRELAAKAGRIGGKVSRRGKAFLNYQELDPEEKLFEPSLSFHQRLRRSLKEFTND